MGHFINSFYNSSNFQYFNICDIQFFPIFSRFKGSLDFSLSSLSLPRFDLTLVVAVHPDAVRSSRDVARLAGDRPVTVNFRCQTSRNPGSRRLERIIHGSSRARKTWGMTPPYDFATIVRCIRGIFQNGVSKNWLFHSQSIFDLLLLLKLFPEKEIKKYFFFFFHSLSCLSSFEHYKQLTKRELHCVIF